MEEIRTGWWTSRTGRTILAIAMLLVGAGIGTSAMVLADNGPATYYACVNDSSGAIHMARASAACGNHESKISWDQQGPKGLTWRGPWSATASYASDDAVSYNGNSFIAVAANANEAPGSGSSWNLLAAKGDKGDTGATGQTGAAGQNGADGKTILSGIGAPGGAVGQDGDFYLDTQAETLYGPKANGAWPATGTNLIGPAGQFVSGSCATGSVVTGVASDGTLQCTDPASLPQQCSVADAHPGANLAACDFRMADLNGANLAGANLAVSNLLGAQLLNAVLRGANLNGANLTGADLTHADLFSANLSNAILSGANFTFTNLTGANLTGANLSGVIWQFTTCPDGFTIGALGTCVGHF